jgi:predicted nucleotidyltransferase
MKQRRLIPQLLHALCPYQPEQVYLFGSFAREEEDELSDLDVVVIKRTAQPFLERLHEVGRLLPADLGAVDILVSTPEEFAAMLANGNAFAEMIAEEGRLIYDQQAQN